MTARWACGALVAAGCTVGPKYHVPPAPMPHVDAYMETTWKQATPSDWIPRGAWWKTFRQPELDGLEARLQVDNQTILQAFDNYAAACAQIRSARAQYWPTVNVSPSVNVGRGSTAFGAGAGSAGIAGIGTGSAGAAGTVGGGGTGVSTGGAGSSFRTIYSLPAEVSWAPDLFGRVRNTVRQGQANAQASAADLESTRLLEQATLASTYFQLRGQDALIAVLTDTVKTDRAILEIAQGSYQTGVGDQLAVVQAEQTLRGVEAQLTGAGIARAQYEHAIATLIGVPASGFTLPVQPLHAFVPVIPPGTPSQLLERRPDIAAAERRMAAANAQIGIGYAAYYPQLSLTGNLGLVSDSLATLFSWPSRVWAIGVSLGETVFDGGARKAVIDNAVASYQAAVAGYRQTVLAAFQQVEDELAATRLLAAEIEQERAAVALAQRGLELERARYQSGIDAYLGLMTAQNTLLGAQQTLVTLETQQMIGVVALIQALGGGWDRALLPTPRAATKTRPTGR